jgi:hypothetical protein
MHYVVVVDDHARKFTQRFGGIGMNGLPNDHPLIRTLMRKFVGLDVRHALHEPSQVKIGVGMPGFQDTNCALSSFQIMPQLRLLSRDVDPGDMGLGAQPFRGRRHLGRLPTRPLLLHEDLGARARRRHKTRDAVNDRIIYNPPQPGEARQGFLFLIAVRRATVR